MGAGLQIPLTHLQDIKTHEVDVLRLDLIHPVTGGNKYFKLKYNLAAALNSEHHTICTFGGAFSNHIAATAQACREAGLKSIGVIRGEDKENSPTLQFARETGMKLIFVDRNTYAHKTEKSFIGNLHREFGDFHLVPEGGNNEEGIRGAAEIVAKNIGYDYILCACGTGTTYAGILRTCGDSPIVVGISVLKGRNALPANVMAMRGFEGTIVGGDEQLNRPQLRQHCILSAYSFSGYAAFNKELIAFKTAFEARNRIPLDYVYTVKLFYAVYDLTQRAIIPSGSRVLVVHSGGLQGNAGFERRYRQRLNL